MKKICPNNFAHVGKSCGAKCICFKDKTAISTPIQKTK